MAIVTGAPPMTDTAPETIPSPPGPNRRPRRWGVIVGIGVLVIAAVVVASQVSFSTEDVPEQLASATLRDPDDFGTSVDSGEQAPDFTVRTLDGGTFSLSEHLADDGRPVFLNMWASWCLPCREEMPAIQALSERQPGVKFVGVALRDNEDAAYDFAKEIGVTYTLGFDEQWLVDAAYLPFGLPATYIVSSEGLLLQRHFGPLTEEQFEGMLATWFGG